MLADPYPVRPWTAPCRGEVSLPGSKSLTNRALVLAALAEGPVRLEGALFSRDSLILCDCLRRLGFDLSEDPQGRVITITGRGGRIPREKADLFVGNAGTAARFLTALVCLHPNGTYRFDGDEEMRRRPMRGLTDALSRLGAAFQFEGEPGFFPFTVRTRGLDGSSWQVDASASSQMLSALMMVAPRAHTPVELNATGARPAFVSMTARLMEQFGVRLDGSSNAGYRVPAPQGYRLPEAVYRVEPDVSAASYFLALPLVTGGSLDIIGLRDDMLQGDIAFTEVLLSLGAQFDKHPRGWTVSRGDPPSGFPRSFDFETFSDTFLTLAAVAPLLPGEVTITGIGHTRHQETDRIAAMAGNLQRLGVPVEEGPDFLRISPFQEPVHSGPPVLVKTFRDHRVAMSFAVLGCRDRRRDGRPWLRVADPACSGKTFPEFFSVLEDLYQNSHDT